MLAAGSLQLAVFFTLITHLANLTKPLEVSQLIYVVLLRLLFLPSADSGVCCCFKTEIVCEYSYNINQFFSSFKFSSVFLVVTSLSHIGSGRQISLSGVCG